MAPLAETGGPTPAASGAGSDPLEAVPLVRRATNYLAAAMLYLRDNALLEQPLRVEHIKPRLLGHWGTCPGLNAIYAALNRVILNQPRRVMLVTGPGHGAPAILANLWLEGTLGEHYPAYSRDPAGLARLVAAFSWPGGFPSHLSPEVPGVIHEGGELGYALATAAGSVLDDPDLVTACVIGDGEAETGPTAASWLTNRFIDPVTSGAVLPVLHLNGYKISNPSVWAAMSDDELITTFGGLGWAPVLVDLRAAMDPDQAMAIAMDSAFEGIDAAQARARSGGERLGVRWPIVLMRSDKGWTGVKEVDGRAVEGTWRSHQIPLEGVHDDPDRREALADWLASYRPGELFDDQGPRPEVLAGVPSGAVRMGMVDAANGGRRRRPLELPDLEPVAADPRKEPVAVASPTATLGAWLAGVIRTQEHRHLRIVSPDELASNKLDAVLEVTDRCFTWPLSGETDRHNPAGMVMEVLSEHLCQGWLEGYLLTGRHGLFPCYEAFIPIVEGMVNQYAKFLKVSREVPWRVAVSSLNLLLTSEGWRQEHNGYSHQGPGFINTMLTKKGSLARIYLPPDANTLLVTARDCLESTDRVNVVVAGKKPSQQWFSLGEAEEHCRRGASCLRWASWGGVGPDVVLAAAGDVPTVEVLAAASLLRADVGGLAARVVNVCDLFALEDPDHHPHGLSRQDFGELFGSSTPVIFSFHGYASAIHELVAHRPNPERFHVHGYREEGTTTTPFDLLVANRASRFDLALDALERAGCDGREAEEAKARYRWALAGHGTYIEAHGHDPPELEGWTWP